MLDGRIGPGGGGLQVPMKIANVTAQVDTADGPIEDVYEIKYPEGTPDINIVNAAKGVMLGNGGLLIKQSPDGSVCKFYSVFQFRGPVLFSINKVLLAA